MRIQLNENFTVLYFVVGAWTHENSKIKSTAKISVYGKTEEKSCDHRSPALPFRSQALPSIIRLAYAELHIMPACMFCTYVIGLFVVCSFLVMYVWYDSWSFCAEPCKDAASWCHCLT